MKTPPSLYWWLRVVTLLLCSSPALANPELAGHWQLDIEQSSPLSGWQDMALVIAVDGSEVEITHQMRWRRTNYRATNVVDTSKTVTSDSFFRVEQRHMAVYPTKGGLSHTTAEWIDADQTLRTETQTMVEVSQGDVPMRITSEYRIGEGAETLTWIVLRSSRSRPLVYLFRKVEVEAAE